MCRADNGRHATGTRAQGPVRDAVQTELQHRRADLALREQRVRRAARVRGPCGRVLRAQRVPRRARPRALLQGATAALIALISNQIALMFTTIWRQDRSTTDDSDDLLYI